MNRQNKVGVKLHHNIIGTLKELELWENRFMNCCLFGEEQGILFSKDRMYPVDVEEYSRVCGMTRGKAYDAILEIVSKLKEYTFEIKLIDGSTYVTSLVYDYIYRDDTKTILVNWNSKFIPLISGHMEAGKFMVLDQRITSISSNKRYLLYVLIEKNLWKLDKLDAFFLDKQEIRDTLGLEDTEYSEFKALHAKIIKPTLKDIYNKIGIELETKVKGNKVMFSYKQKVIC